MRPIIEVIPAGLSFPVLSTGHSAATWPSPPLADKGPASGTGGGPGCGRYWGMGHWASQRPAGHVTSLTTRLPVGAAHFREEPEGIRGQQPSRVGWGQRSVGTLGCPQTPSDLQLLWAGVVAVGLGTPLKRLQVPGWDRIGPGATSLASDTPTPPHPTPEAPPCCVGKSRSGGYGA